MAIIFRTVLRGEGRTAAGIVVPEELMAELGPAKRYPVVVTVNGSYTYRNSVSWYKGAFMISLSSENQRAAGVKGGDEVDITVELDDAPRVLELPAEFALALKDAGVLDAFQALSYSKQRALVEPWSAAKTDATRDKNLAKAIAAAAG
jgi:hypothetical protein